MSESTVDPRSLWARTASGDDLARDEILRENLNLVHHVARQLSRSLAVEADFDELVSAGTIGLMTALKAFDASARPRVQHLRRTAHSRLDPRRAAPPGSRAPFGPTEGTRDLASPRVPHAPASAASRKTPSSPTQLGTDVQTLWRWQSEVEGAVHLSLTSTAGDGGATIPVRGEFLRNDEEGADERLSRESEVAMLREAILRLNDQERTVLSLYYFEELKSAEIAEVLGISESRVSQIRSKALARLRCELAPLRASA